MTSHNLPKTFFVTGIDTGTGKTLVTIALMQSLRAAGHKVYGMKPVASGCRMTTAGLVSDDALLIQKHCSDPLPYSVINPVTLETPCSPNIAALIESRECKPDAIMQSYEEVCRQSGYVFIEGIGGWRTPFCDSFGMADLVRQLGIPVILVVGLRLGCINHALLTIEVMKQDNVEIAGWVVNQPDPDYQYTPETVAYLKTEITSSLLGVIPYLGENNFNVAGTFISSETLLNKILGSGSV